MKTNAIKNLVIVGANATGWTAAFVLASYLKGLEVNIKVIDCPDAQDTNRAISLPPAT
jgi:hypothetical protein